MSSTEALPRQLLILIMQSQYIVTAALACCYSLSSHGCNNPVEPGQGMPALLAPHVHMSRPGEICAAMTLVVAQVSSYCSNAPVITNDSH